MLETTPQDSASNFLNKMQLTKLKLRAMRSGVWFRALPRIDRALFDLTIKVASNIRSITLAKNILSVIRKLDGLLENRLLRAIKEVGVPTAYKLSMFAQKWGNISAKNWVSDMRFARFLAIMSFNNPKGFTT